MTAAIVVLLEKASRITHPAVMGGGIRGGRAGKAAGEKH